MTKEHISKDETGRYPERPEAVLRLTERLDGEIDPLVLKLQNSLRAGVIFPNPVVLDVVTHAKILLGILPADTEATGILINTVRDTIDDMAFFDPETFFIILDRKKEVARASEIVD